jgi:hypothetical protein
MVPKHAEKRYPAEPPRPPFSYWNLFNIPAFISAIRTNSKQKNKNKKTKTKTKTKAAIKERKLTYYSEEQTKKEGIMNNPNLREK